MVKKNLAQEVVELIIRDYYDNITIDGSKELPTQIELQKKYYVSRSTVVKALNILKEKKVIYSIQGKGSFFVEGKLSLSLEGIYSYDYQLNEAGIEIENKVISYQVIIPNEEIQALFNLAKDEKIIEIIRKKIDQSTKETLIVQRNYLRYVRFESLSAAKINEKRLYVVLTNDYNLKLTKAKERIMLTTLPKELRKYADKKNQQMLKIIRQAYESEMLVEYTESYLLTPNFIYNVDLSFHDF